MNSEFDPFCNCGYCYSCNARAARLANTACGDDPRTWGTNGTLSICGREFFARQSRLKKKKTDRMLVYEIKNRSHGQPYTIILLPCKGDWWRIALQRAGITDNEITAALVAIRMRGEP